MPYQYSKVLCPATGAGAATVRARDIPQQVLGRRTELLVTQHSAAFVPAAGWRGSMKIKQAATAYVTKI